MIEEMGESVFNIQIPLELVYVLLSVRIVDVLYMFMSASHTLYYSLSIYSSHHMHGHPNVM